MDQEMVSRYKYAPLAKTMLTQPKPVMDGLTCTKKIRELEKEGKFAQHVPVIAVTANARSEQIQTALNAGMVSSCVAIVIDRF